MDTHSKANPTDNLMHSVKERLSLIMNDFSQDEEDEKDLIWMCPNVKHFVDKEDAPVPGLILLLFHKMLEYPLGYRGDKTHWAQPFKFLGFRCSIALQKFGLRLYVEEKGKDLNPKEILGKIEKGILFIQRSTLSEFSEQQIKNGNLSISNRYHEFLRRYTFFREKAQEAYNESIARANENRSGALEKMFGFSFSLSTEGIYYSLAMIDSFFSMLEHLLVLLLPFCDYNTQEDDIVKFIGCFWLDKYKRIFDVNSNQKAKQYYDELYTIKERFRNTYAHGGFEKNGASLHFRLPEVGLIPVQFTNIRNNPMFSFELAKLSAFEDVCGLFDDFLSWIESGHLKLAFRYIQSSMGVSFSSDSITEYSKVIADEELFNEWLEYKNHLHDTYVNADY